MAEMHVTYLMKEASAKNKYLREFYSVAASTFNALTMMSELFSLTTKLLDDKRKAVNVVSPDGDALLALMREMNLMTISFHYEPALRGGQFLTLYGSCEGAILRLCRCFYFVTRSKLRVEDLAGRGITAAASYLSKVIELPLPFFFSADAEGEFMTQVRNKLAHTGGRVEGREATILEDARGRLLRLKEGTMSDDIRHNLASSYLTVSDYGNAKTITITEKFNEAALVLINVMLTSLLHSSEEKMLQLVGNTQQP